MKQLLRYTVRVMVLVLAGLIPVAGYAEESGFATSPEVIEMDNPSVRFQVKLFGLARIVGQFERIYGKLMNSAVPEAGHVHMKIEVSSVNTRDEWRDDYLRSSAFFDVERYPHISFSGTYLDLGEDGRKRVVGHLSLHGTTRPVAFEVEPAGSNEDHDTHGYLARATIKRSEFGLDSLKHIVSDDVEITVAMRAGQVAGL